MALSIIIPIKNGAPTLERCLKSIRSQTMQPGEIIIMDSGSEDDSIEIAKKFDCQIVSIPPESFDHGLTRNLGVKHAKGDLVFLTVQDAWIPDVDMLERMSRHFDDTEVMAVTGHQAVPHEKDKNPLVWYRRYSEYSVDIRQVKDANMFKNLPQTAQQKLVAWDNVIAMYRKSALLEVPFVQTEMSEDWMWSYQALQKGWKLLRDSSLVVYHYHHRTPHYVFKTAWSLNYHFYKFFGYKPTIPAIFKPTLQSVYHLFRNKELDVREKFYWWGHNLLALLSEWFSDVFFLWKLRTTGGEGIENSYQKFCKRIPQGRQKNQK